MRKSKKQIEEVVQAWTQAMHEKYPSVRQEVHLEERDGHHAWLRLYLSPEMRPLNSEIARYSVELTDQFWDTGVWVMGLVIQEKEPVHG